MSFQREISLPQFIRIADNSNSLKKMGSFERAKEKKEDVQRSKEERARRRTQGPLKKIAGPENS